MEQNCTFIFLHGDISEWYLTKYMLRNWLLKSPQATPISAPGSAHVLVSSIPHKLVKVDVSRHMHGNKDIKVEE